VCLVPANVDVFMSYDGVPDGSSRVSLSCTTTWQACMRSVMQGRHYCQWYKPWTMPSMV
jgi:hypothetical protein